MANNCDLCEMIGPHHETRTFRCVRCSTVRWITDGAAVYVLGVRIGHACYECPRDPQERRSEPVKRFVGRSRIDAATLDHMPTDVAAFAVAADAVAVTMTDNEVN